MSAGATNTTNASAGPNGTAPSPPGLLPSAFRRGRAMRTTVNTVTSTTTTAARLACTDMVVT
jgi:hypothetical protein